jgi:hypothetical protein
LTGISFDISKGISVPPYGSMVLYKGDMSFTDEETVESTIQFANVVQPEKQQKPVISEKFMQIEESVESFPSVKYHSEISELVKAAYSNLKAIAEKLDITLE